MNDQMNNWEDLLPATVLSMNASVNSTSGYSPHEIVYGHLLTIPTVRCFHRLQNLTQRHPWISAESSVGQARNSKSYLKDHMLSRRLFLYI